MNIIIQAKPGKLQNKVIGSANGLLAALFPRCTMGLIHIKAILALHRRRYGRSWEFTRYKNVDVYKTTLTVGGPAGSEPVVSPAFL